MKKKTPTNVAASIRQRLLNLANERKTEFQLVLIRYGLERLLHRLYETRYKDQFLLKGAMLFQLWTGEPHRSTLDLDLLGNVDDSVARYEAIFREICQVDVEEDGLKFDPDQIHGEEIREEKRYAGVRIHGVAMLGTARIPLQIDIGFGDVVTPKAESVQYPSLLGFPTPTLKAYPKETVVAEKFEAMVSLGIANSRMKDFYDLWVLAHWFEFDGEVLASAIKATCKRRGTFLPTQPPIALTPEFSANPAKEAQWQAFVRRGRLLETAPSLATVCEVLVHFIWPVAEAIVLGSNFPQHWKKGGPWQ